MRHLWTLDPTFVFLNHGSFGACPRAVQDVQDRLRARLESQPLRFFDRESPGLLAEARAALGGFLGADPDDLAFVPNATAGVNTVLRSLSFTPGDELLTTDHEYRACRNALDAAAERAGARVVVAEVPFPLSSEDDAVDPVLAAVTPRTRLALLDHVTSPTGLVVPIERLARELGSREVDVLVDGAHAPGMVELDLRSLGAAYYTGNAHKWMYAPKGCAFLWVRRDLQPGIRPLSISHGATAPLEGQTRFRLEFDWTGTADPTPYLAIPAALRFGEALFPGGWAEIRRRNRELALAARALLCEALGVASPAPASMIGSLAAVPLPDGDAVALQDALYAAGIEVPIVPWPEPPRRLVRVAAAPYNALDEYARLAGVLVQKLKVSAARTRFTL